MPEIKNSAEELVIDPQDAQDNKVMAILCYLFFLVPLIGGLFTILK